MSDLPTVVFISGANRGLGYGFAVQLVARGCNVVAGYRDKSSSHALLHDAQAHPNLFPVRVDVTDDDGLSHLHDFIAEQFGHLDLLINNAAINEDGASGLHDLAWDGFAHVLDVNIGGPFRTTQRLYPLLRAGRDKKVVHITSGMGSISQSEGGWTSYRVSKAGLHMLTRNQAAAYRPDGVTVVAISPGWVRTDMGGSAAPLSVEQSVTAMLVVIDAIDIANTGRVLSYDGKPLIL